ncbi:non-homologous end joining protein Ku [Streptomyces sp. 8N706]|uniref:non-homologous end joining protein Ku n=1 Tax=Streptomyces sp. 8N706 TaxID=3457416 RepID=UPI003FD5D72C
MPPPTIVKLHITFGLVSVPVDVHPATARHSVPLHLVHTRCGSRVRLHRFCEAEGIEIPREEIARGYEADGRTVILTDADLADLPLPSMKNIEVLAFVPADRIDPLLLDRAYYLSVDGPVAARPYVLLRDAMRETGQVAIARAVIRTRENLAVLRPRGEIIAMQTMLWPDELRPADGLEPPAHEPRPQELEMADLLMEQLTRGFHLEQQEDAYQRALERVVEAKLTGAEPPHAPEAPTAPIGAVDLMAELERSVAAAKARETSPAEPPLKEARAKKSPPSAP